MHGDFKTPGGKLVRVDFAVADGRLRDVMVSGDFFLYPEEAFLPITATLEGAPADLTQAAFADRIAAAIADGTQWLGSSPEALGAAIVRALEDGEAAGE